RPDGLDAQPLRRRRRRARVELRRFARGARATDEKYEREERAVHGSVTPDDGGGFPAPMLPRSEGAHRVEPAAEVVHLPRDRVRVPVVVPEAHEEEVRRPALSEVRSRRLDAEEAFARQPKAPVRDPWIEVEPVVRDREAAVASYLERAGGLDAEEVRALV